jgi:glycosyltransferase involved in cell wall biosynthesis
MKNKKNLIYVIAYNAEKHIESVLDLIDCSNDEQEILVSDDASKDRTSKIVANFIKNNPQKNIKLVTQKNNLGYGGNQKFGFNYAIKNNFDVLVLMHGDGQYSPKLISALLQPIFEKNKDLVLGSRMMERKNALKGGMPLYKFIGNIVLTNFQNILLGSNLAEFHTGLRAYKIPSLAKLPFQHNSNGFPFDTDILIQFIDNKMEIGEIAIPTHYGDEVCHVPGMRYAIAVAMATVISKLQKWGICNYPKFNYEGTSAR